MGYNSVKNSYIKGDIPSVDRVVPSGEGMGGTPPRDLDPLPIKTQICPPPCGLGSPHHPKLLARFAHKMIHTDWFLLNQEVYLEKRKCRSTAMMNVLKTRSTLCEPPPDYRLAWRRRPDGNKYFSHVAVKSSWGEFGKLGVAWRH